MLTDYGKLHVSGDEYSVLRPDSVCAAVREQRAALAHGASLRVRGSGHALSGASLPRPGETLVQTHGLDHYRVEAPRLLTVGGGAVLWDIRDFASRHGLRLPIYNGGWAGPTVGGFVCAGGLGRAGTETYGGFWAQVAQITIVDGLGEVHDIRSGDELFPWLFGSLGQFGLILEVTLRLLERPGAADDLPVGSSGRIPVSNPLNPDETDSLPPEEGIDWVYWFTALVPVAEEDAAWKVIGDWSSAHRDMFTPIGGWLGPVQDGLPIGFRYLVRRLAPTPPMLYPLDEDFVALGVMAVCGGIGTDAAEAALTQAERAFVTRILDHGWSLYCQAENLTRSLDYRAYLGPARWTRFCELKDRFDPGDRINPGEVRPGPVPSPATARLVRRFANNVRPGLRHPLLG